MYQLTLVNSLLGRRSEDGRAGQAITGTITSGGVTQPSPRPSPIRSGVHVHTIREIRVDDAYGTSEVKVQNVALHPLGSPSTLDTLDESEKSELADGFITPPSERVHSFA